MRRIFQLFVVALLVTGPAAAQARPRPAPRPTQGSELGSRERGLLLQSPLQRSGGLERTRALQLGNGAPADLGSIARRNALRGVVLTGTRVQGSAESLGAVERATLLRRGPVLLQAERRAANPSGHVSGRVLAHRLRRR